MIVTVVVTGPLERATLGASTEQKAAGTLACGEQPRATTPWYPPVGARISVYVAACPCCTVALSEEPDAVAIENEPVCRPVPIRGTVMGEAGSLLLTVREAVRAPTAVGVKVTPSRQLALAAMVADGHPVVTTKSLVATMLACRALTGAVPLLISASVRAAD